MDLVASRLAKDYKMKDKKRVKRLANNDSIKKKSAPNLEKSLKQKIKTNPDKISLKKKQLIKDTILDKNDKNKLILKENSLSKKTNVGKKSTVDISKDTKVTKAALKDNKSALKDKLNLCPSLIPSIGNKKIGKDLIKNKKVKETKIEKTSLKGNKLVPKEKLDLPPIKISNNSDKVIDNGSIKSKKNKNSKKKIVLENQVTSVPTQKKSKKLKSDKSGKVKHVASEKLISTVNVEFKNSNIQKQDTKLDKESKSTNNSKTTLVKSEQTINEEIKSTKTKKRKLSDSTDKPTGLTLKKKQVIQYVQGLKKLLQNEEPKKKSLFDSERSPVFMQLISIKVPKVPLHQLRITIPHSLLSPDDDVALIVKDLKRGRRVDFENTIHHYEDILQKNGCTRVKTVIPFNQLKTEYSQYEMKRRLFSSYDYFLIDGRIAGHVAHVLGTIFRKGRKMPTSIHMDKKNLKGEIEKALNKTCLQIHANGNTSIVQVGHLAMEDEKIADNILAVVENLGKNFPGGLNNVRSLLIKTPLSLAIPIYVTLKNKNEVEVPDILPKRPKAYKSVEGELSTFTSNVKVSVEPDGTVTVLKIGGSDSDKEISEDEQSENEADEVIQQKKVKSDEAVEEESEEED